MRCVFVFVCLLACWVSPLTAQPNIYTPTEADLNNTNERIIAFHADIYLQNDGNIKVKEYFTIYAARKSIRRGIVRNIPEIREDAKGKKRYIPIRMISLKRNGEPSRYILERYSGEMLLYTGSEDILLEKGIHQYEFAYETRGKVGHDMRGHVTFFDDYAELFWNVMGDQSVYEIENASATVHLSGTTATNWLCYTGKAGSTEQAYTCDGNESSPTFKVSRVLNAEEGFSVAVAFPREIIRVPVEMDLFLERSINWIMGITYLVIVMIISWMMWLIFGRGARRPAIMPQFSAPNGWSAEKVHYLYKHGVNGKTFTAAILQMAVRKAIGIECQKKYNDKTAYFITRNNLNNQQLSKEQQNLFRKLFKSSSYDYNDEEIELSKNNEFLLTKAREDMEESLKKLIPLERLYTVNRGCIIASLTIHIFFFLLYIMGYDFYNNDIVSVCLMPIFQLAMHLFLIHKLKKLTPFGAKVKSELEGLKMYISKAEKRWLNILTPPEKTPEHFEEMLPYAVALGVENKWCDKFHDVLQKCNYKPAWYNDSGQDISDISRDLSRNVIHSINNSVVRSSSYRPVSSSSSSSSGSWGSGSSGGSSSGGGGGGGGVRGW